MNTQFKVLNIVGIFLLILPILVVIIDRVGNSDLSSEDSDAVYGGLLEQEYKSAGYMIAYTNGSGASICGLVKVDSDLAITAAHCLKDATGVYLAADPSEPQIILSSLPATTYVKPDWNGSNIPSDIALLSFENENTDGYTYANITAPKMSCDYTVVGYGRTEFDPETISIDREKRSASVCITLFDNNLIYIEGNNSGICLGDSGSPIYETGTDNAVGIISSVVVDSSLADEPCYIGNKGIAVRLDNNLDFITSTGASIINETQPPAVVAEVETLATDLELEGNDSGDKKILGIETNLATKAYLAIVVIYIIIYLRFIIFRQKE